MSEETLLNLIVVHSGDYYNIDYVNRLYAGAKKHTTVPFNFVVFTDSPNKRYPKEYRVITLPAWELDQKKAWWYKLAIFNSNYKLVGNNLFLDLDVVICKDLSKFWNFSPSRFRICRDFNRVFISKYHKSNSSIMGWQDDSMGQLYNNFERDRHAIISRYRGDQDFIDISVHSRVFWPDTWAMSYKWELWRGGMTPLKAYKNSIESTVIPEECSIAVFHGKPNPHNITNDQFIRDNWINA